MAENKKSFVLYVDQKNTVDKLPDEIAGKLLKLIYSYCNDENPVVEDLMLDIAFEPIKQQLKRDLVKYEQRAKNSRKNGAKGGRPPINQKPSGFNRNPTEPKKPVNDTVNDTVNVTDIVTVNDKKESTTVYPKEVNDCYLRCLKFFPDQLKPKNKKIQNKWLDTIDKLNRIDNVPFDLIVDIVKKTREDEFWSKNFLSLTKLRQKKDGVMYIVSFNEKFKSNKSNNGKTRETDEERHARLFKKYGNRVQHG